MSDKPKVYQGVRVKTTVKELLQRHRAREANSKKVKTISQPCLALQDLCVSSFPSRYVDPPITIPSSADSSSNSSARSLQQRADSFSFPDSSCNIHMQECAFNDTQEQLGDMQLPGNGYDSVNNNINNNNNVGGYNSSFLPLAASLPSPWCRGLSSDADNCYGHGVAPCSTPESLKLCNPIDHNSYSPQDSFSSSSSSCYDSPPRMESSYHSFPSEHFHYQHCNLQDCYCLAHCWPGQQESLSAPEFAPYYNPTDYAYTCPVEQSYLKRELQMSSDMCYNVL